MTRPVGERQGMSSFGNAVFAGPDGFLKSKFYVKPKVKRHCKKCGTELRRGQPEKICSPCQPRVEPT